MNFKVSLIACLVLPSILLGCARAKSSQQSSTETRDEIPLFGIEMIDDRNTPSTSWNFPKGFDASVQLFGTYQLELVRSCAKTVSDRLTSWANEHEVATILAVDEIDRIILHGQIPDKRGFFEFRYRVFTNPNRAIVSANFVRPSGQTASVNALAGELIQRYQITVLTYDLRRTLRCLDSSE